MSDAPKTESRFYVALAMITLPVVIIAATSVALGGRPAGSTGLLGGVAPLLIAELLCLGPVFLGGFVVAFLAIIGSDRHRDGDS